MVVVGSKRPNPDGEAQLSIPYGMKTNKIQMRPHTVIPYTILKAYKVSGFGFKV